MSKSLLHVCDGRAGAGGAPTKASEILDAVRPGNRPGLERVTHQESSRSPLRRAVQNLLLGGSVVGVTLVVAALRVVVSVVWISGIKAYNPNMARVSNKGKPN
jgi:hypothetical protein